MMGANASYGFCQRHQRVSFVDLDARFVSSRTKQSLDISKFSPGEMLCDDISTSLHWVSF